MLAFMQRQWLAPLMVSLIWALPAGAKQVGEAISDLGEVEGTDPNGFRLMLICIGILVVVAATLIGVTVTFMLKGKSKKQ